MNPNTSSIASLAAALVAIGAMVVNLRLGTAAVAPPVSADAALQSLADDHAALSARVASLGEDVRGLERRLVSAESQRRAVPPSAVVAASQPESAPGREPPAAARQAGEPGDTARLQATMAAMFRAGTQEPGLTESEQEQFWRQLRTPGFVDELVTRLEAEVAAHPGDAEARMQLADAYTAKLFTIPGGPEQGVWGGKAERQWAAVVEQQPDHWEARFALGFNYSMYPPFVDKSKEAIEHLEAARRLLAVLPVEPKQVDTFTALARMYQRQGKVEQALEVLAAGLQRFPGDESLLRTRQQLGATDSR